MGARGSVGFPLSGPYQVFLAEKRETEFTFSSYLALASSPLPYSRSLFCFPEEMETCEEAKEFCDRSSLLIPRVTCRDMDILSCLRAWRKGLSVLSKRPGGRTRLVCLKVAGSSTPSA